ncbi:MAG: hypothetical protein ACKVVO_02955, partial [Opitutaceae bacterium]
MLKVTAIRCDGKRIWKPLLSLQLGRGILLDGTPQNPERNEDFGGGSSDGTNNPDSARIRRAASGIPASENGDFQRWLICRSVSTAVAHPTDRRHSSRRIFDGTA